MTPTRRGLLGAALAALVAGPAAAHTPFRQWVVYRRKHLLIGAHRGDARTYALAKALEAALALELPEARARVARGPRPQRIAKLIGTGQLMTAVLADAEARAMVEARPPFEAEPPTPLLRMAALERGYSLYASFEFPPDHAYMVASAIAEAGLAAPPKRDDFPPHQGALAFWDGRPPPE